MFFTYHNFSKYIIGRHLNSPKAIAGSTKYGDNGLYTAESFAGKGLPRGLEKALANMANHSLAKNTWSTYKTAYKHIETCSEDTGRSISFPMSSEDVLLFTGWLLSVREVKASTAESYLSALRQIHLIKGLVVPALRPDIVKTILTGAKHVDTIRDRLQNKPKRIPVTVDMLKMIKLELGEMKIPRSQKRLFWAVCTLNFFGGFRVHETLSRAEGYFDPCFTLLRRDIRIKEIKVGKETEKIIQVRIKSPKEDRTGKEILVDVYESGGILCPVRAYEKWRATNPPADKNKPAFRDKKGTLLTGRRLNQMLKKCLEKHIHYTGGSVSSHSFRSGIASLMGTLGPGSPNSDIWESIYYECTLLIMEGRVADLQGWGVILRVGG